MQIRTHYVIVIMERPLVDIEVVTAAMILKSHMVCLQKTT